MNVLTEKQLEILHEFDPVKEFEDWAATAANKGIEWESNFWWNKRRSTEAFHPSSLGDHCDMVLFLELVGGGVVRKTKSSDQMIFDVGTAIHELMHYYQGTRAKYFKYQYQKEVSFDFRKKTKRPDLAMSGHADGVTIGWPIEAPILWEYKSIKDSAFQRLKSPSIGYLVQVHAYMANLGIPYSIMLFINKNDSSLAAFKIPFNQAFWEPHENRVKYLIKLAEELEEPKRNVGGKCYRCRFLEECLPPNISQRGEELEVEDL